MIGKSIERVDAIKKVTGQAQYTDDFCGGTVLVAKVCRSTIANGLVKSIDVKEALKVLGVVKIVTCFDVPDIGFGTPGHPYSLEPAHRSIMDRRLLNRRVRIWGDEIAAVVATDDLAANRAVRAIRVEYEEYEPILSPQQAVRPEAAQLHEGFLNNILCKESFIHGKYEESLREEGLLFFEDEFDTQRAQHCHIENPCSYAYMDGDRIVVVSSTQIPHILRRVVGQALGIPWGMVRVIKPYVGGGFGNKQEVLYEPLNAFLCTQVGGRTVKLELTREETFMCTRSRHAIHFTLRTAVRPDGQMVARYINAVSDQGGYASHGHIVVANSVKNFEELYQQTGGIKADVSTVYTNLGTSGAMRGYGIPQITFAVDCHMEDIALKLGLDPIEFRLQNMMTIEYKSKYLDMRCHSIGAEECIQKGRDFMRWDEKRAQYQHQTGPVRRGIGMSVFCYPTGVYPLAIEVAGARMILNPDGSAQLQMGAVEIGQGADTVFTQMAAQTAGLKPKDIHIVSTQDTDICPFDLGAYASRQSYVSGMAVKETARQFKQKLLAVAEKVLDFPAADMDIVQSEVVNKATGEMLVSVEAVAMHTFYNTEDAVHIFAESSVNCKNNTYAFGACFAEVEVDMELGKIKILNIINVHDSGIIINPAVAEAQVHGGMSMGIGYSLAEQMQYDGRGRLVNGNLLDYKLQTSMDSPELYAGFVETDDPTGPYGNKALGEPPAIPQAPAIRNAVLQATGVAFNTLPLHPEKLVAAFKKAGLI